MRRTLAIGALALGLILSGCGAGTSTPGSTSDTGSDMGSGYGDSGSSDAVASGLALADTSLGEVIVDGNGMTAYVYDKDTQGASASACTGACLQTWPPILVSAEKPTADGITGELGTIKTPDGKMQVTLNGWPLYLYAGDAKAGDVTGQGFKGIWWVVDAAGMKIGG